MKYKYIFFDVAGTLLYKPRLYNTIRNSFKSFGHNVGEDLLIRRHKIISEAISFPEKTSYKFYDYFNRELLYSLGIVPSKELIDNIYKNCKNLRWEKFPDTKFLNELDVDLGIIANWDSSLKKKLKEILDSEFKNVIISSEVKLEKPNLKIFKKAASKVGFPANKMLFIGDSIKLDIEPALRVGFKTVLIDRYNVYPSFNGLKIKNLYELKDIIKK